MENTEPVIEKPVCGVTVKRAPKNTSAEPGPPYDPENRDKGNPGKEGKPLVKKQVGEGRGKKNCRNYKRGQIYEKIERCGLYV